MLVKENYRNYFINPKIARHRYYEALRARFVEKKPVKEIASMFRMSFHGLESIIRDFKKGLDNGKPMDFFLQPSPGPKKDRKKPLVREHIIRLRKRCYASTDIHRALNLAGIDVSLSLIDHVLREEGLTGLHKRTKQERDRVAQEIHSRKVPGLTIPQQPSIEVAQVADVRKLDMNEGKTFSSRFAGIFLFVPFLIKVGIHHTVAKSHLPGTKMIPAICYLLSLLSLKLLDKERKSHITDWNFDQLLGLFAGLNTLPKTTVATDYSYRLVDNQHNRLLAEWVEAAYPVLCPGGCSTFALDFHAIPHRGENTGLENHYVPRRGKATSSVLTFFARSIDSPMLCYAEADIVSAEQVKMVLKFVEYWETITGFKPQWLYFDSKLTTYTSLDLLNKQDINFITIRRRGTALVDKILSRSEWQTAVIDTPQRRHQRINYLDDKVKLKDYEGTCRQISVTGLGRAAPTLFLTNNQDISGREVVLRYTRRNCVENDLGINVNFFHLDCLSSEVRLNVNLDVVLTVIANGCYRWLANHLKGFEKMEPKYIFRKFVETSGKVSFSGNNIVVRLDRRSHNTIIAQAKFDEKPVYIPWLKEKRLVFDFE